MLFSRTNYFRVADSDAFAAWLSRIPDLEVRRDGRGRFSLLSRDKETGEMPDMCFLPDSDDLHYCNLQDEVQSALAPEEVAVFYSVGENPDFPDHPYGQATALYAGGTKRLRLNLQDIDVMCSQHFETTPTGFPLEKY
jgi:hypothetical protein